jgi:hypothetical protein
MDPLEIVFSSLIAGEQTHKACFVFFSDADSVCIADKVDKISSNYHFEG